MKIKFKIIFSLIFLTKFTIAQVGWNSEVLLNSKEEPLRIILSSFTKQTNINLIFNDSLIENKELSLSIKDNADVALLKLLKKVNLTFKKFNKNSAVIFKSEISELPIKKKRKVIDNEFKREMDYEIVKPTIVSSLGLKYPEKAIKNKLEGEVQVRLLISKKGEVKKITISKSSGHKILDTATVNHIKRLKFLPAEVNGRTRTVWTTMKVRFNYDY